MNSSITVHSVISASKDQVTGELLEGDVVILNMADDVYYGLNPIGGRIWNLIQEPRIVSEIISTLLDEYDVETEQCTAEVFALLHDLASKGLIVVQNGTPE